MSYAVARIKRGEARALKAGGLWIYDNEIAGVDGSFENGDIVAVEDYDGYFLGYGFINMNSKIRIRVLSRKKEHEITESFMEQRVRDCWEYRKAVVDTDSCRLIFGEADFLPGFVADKFSDVIVVQSLALGIDRWKEFLVQTLIKVLAEDGITIRGVYERSDAKVRTQEGMERVKGFIGPAFDTKVEIQENGVRYYVDVKEGQKTGFFLDQKYNRRAAAALCKDKTVLDCFTHTGSFALNAGLAGDVFELLPQLEREGKKFDVVILDPPAFTKSRNSVKNATKGYKEINRRGMDLVKNGGYLCTCSCSHFMTPELFLQAIRDAARDAHKRLRQVEYRTQAPDHPILMSADESYYLKFVIFQVVDEK